MIKSAGIENYILGTCYEDMASEIDKMRSLISRKGTRGTGGVGMLVVIQASQVNESFQGRSNLLLYENEDMTTFLIKRLQKEGIKDIVIATSDNKDDVDKFTRIANMLDIRVVFGSYYDLPKRLLAAADCYPESKDMVRVFANSPFVDTKMMKELYGQHTAGGYDYSYNEHIHGVLWGCGCDVFNMEFLRKIDKESLYSSQRDTLGIYIRQKRELYKVQEFEYYERRPGYKVNIENYKDFEVAREVAENVDNISCDTIKTYFDRHQVLAKYNLESPPKETGLEKMLLNGDKVKHIFSKEVPDPSYPISVELTLTNSCNMNCVYCSDMMLRERQGKKEHIPLEKFYELFDQLKEGGTKGVVLEGGGEPTLYSHFNEVVKYAKKVGLALGLISNGSVRLDEEVVSAFEWIRVSLDASTEDEYKNIKGVDFFEKVIDNIAYYAKHCETVGVGYVVTSRNISQVEPLVMRLRELGVSYIQFRPVVDCDDIYPYNVELSYLKFYQTNKFGVMVDGMTDNAKGGNLGLPCYANSITSVISGDGGVYICGRLNIYEWLSPIGNICEQPFDDIWNGEERKKQAKMIADAEFCERNCPQCRVSKFNGLFDRLYTVKSKHFI